MPAKLCRTDIITCWNYLYQEQMSTPLDPVTTMQDLLHHFLLVSYIYSDLIVSF